MADEARLLGRRGLAEGRLVKDVGAVCERLVYVRRYARAVEQSRAVRLDDARRYSVW